MVASYFGGNIDISTLRRRFSVSLKGSTLKSLIDCANAMGLVARPIRAEMSALRRVKLPCILHWDMNHFVVLVHATRTRLVIHDPAFGRRNLPSAEVSSHFTGVAIEFTATAAIEQVDKREAISIRSLLGKVSGVKRALSQLIVLGLSLELCVILTPLYLQWAVDYGVSAGNLELLTVLGLGFSTLLLFQVGISSLRGWVIATLGVSLNIQWMLRSFAHLVKLPIEFFEKRSLGGVVSSFSSITTIQKGLTGAFVEALIDGLLAIVTFVMMIVVGGALALVPFIGALLYLCSRVVAHGPLRNASQENIVQYVRQHTSFLETVRGIRTLRLFGKENERASIWNNLVIDQFNADLVRQRLEAIARSASSFFFGAARIATVWIAALWLMESRFSFGALFAFIAYSEQFSLRIGGLFDRIIEFKLLRPHAERLADILLSAPEPIDESNREIDTLRMRLEVRGLWFRYATAEPYVLRDVNFNVEEGEFLAITGPSGCGKSTLAKIMAGLFKPSTGEVLMDNTPVRNIGQKSFSSILGAVMQDDALFMGTIAENISFFDVNPDTAWITSCSIAASIHDEILEMPMGYNTLIGDMGSSLSGGQRQRVLLARALYRRPRWLLLDESSNSLDDVNESKVNLAIARLKVTRIVIAHRRETLEMADRIIYFNKQGEVARIQKPEPAQSGEVSI